MSSLRNHPCWIPLVMFSFFIAVSTACGGSAVTSTLGEYNATSRTDTSGLSIKLHRSKIIGSVFMSEEYALRR